jgi:hypothetical protein
MVVVASGCQPELDLERPTDLVGLGPISLDISIGSHAFEVDLHHHADVEDTCPVLGDDFTAHIGDAPASVYPGGVVENCNSPDTHTPCIPEPATCGRPYLGFIDLPAGSDAILTFGDASRTVECKLGDALAARSVTRIPAGTWDVSSGETVTLRWSPGSDLARLGVKVMFDQGHREPIWRSPTIAGDLVTVEVPRLDTGPQKLVLEARADVATMTKGCNVPNSRVYAYVIEQPITVR